MQKTIDINKLESQAMDCYNYFKENYKNSNFDSLENMLLQLQKSVKTLTLSNLVNIIDKVIEDGRYTKEGRLKQYNVSSIQARDDNRIVLICHEIIGIDTIDKKFILDDVQSFVNFSNVKKIY